MSANNRITIITSLIYLQEHDISISEVLIHLSTLIDIGIPIIIFVDDKYSNILNEHINSVSHSTATNIHVEILNFNDTWIYQECVEREQLQLPQHRNRNKDTYDFILSSHMKHECIVKAIETNHYNTTHFMWLNIDIAKLFNPHKNEVVQFIKELSLRTLDPAFLVLPGCWARLEKNKIQDITSAVHWRFCGGLLFGNKTHLLSFCQLYKEGLPLFLDQYNTLVWDFNLWAWLELEYEEQWLAKWYKADHNESIVCISGDIYTSIIKNDSTEVYDYPAIDTYYPTSSCYIHYNNKHYLNIRYVNYWIYPSGCYLFANGTRLIENKNVIAELDNDTMKPLYYKEIREQIELPVNRTGISIGLEDIRLYEYESRIKYIATTMGYSQCDKSRMIVGDYDIENNSITNGTIIHPPQDTWCEKNWIPIVRKNVDMDNNGFEEEEEEEELFIYKWYPLEIGKIEYDESGEHASLKIIQTHSVPSLVFSKIRGSTVFQETADGYLGVVHFSEEHSPRHYYHMMVVLDKETLQIVKYSETFYFEKMGIEFCIGFKLLDDLNILFWISRHDRDPLTIWTNYNEIKWL
jgi:hypothetical protein